MSESSNENSDDVALTRRVTTSIVGVALMIMIAAYVLTSRYVPERPVVPPAPRAVTLPPVPAQLSALKFDKAPPLVSIDVISTLPGQTLTVAADPRPVALAQRTGTIQVSGWAIDPSAARPAGAVFLEWGDRVLIEGQYGIDRPDVAASFKNPLLTPVGFTFAFPANALRAGDHALDLIVISADGKTYYRAKDRIRVDVR